MVFLLELLLPGACGGCGRAGSIWCAECHAGLRPASRSDERFLRANPGVAVGERLDVAVAALAYEGRLRHALARLKYGAMPRLARPLADAAVPLLRPLLDDVPAGTLVPVPVHQDRMRDRGYNQATLLARELARRVGHPVDELLVRQRPTEKQHRLNRAARLRNLRNAFAVRDGIDRVPVEIVLVDDILTTSATLEACAAVLRDAGAQRVVGVAIAREL